jgi:hypothetical protein
MAAETSNARIPELTLSYLEEDNSNCRVYFRSATRGLYCYQLESRGEFKLFECTRDGEPLASIDPSQVDITLKSTAPGEVKIGQEFLEWHEAMTDQPSSPAL